MPLIILFALTVMQFVIGKYLEPLFSGTALNISPFTVVFSIFFWSFMWGLPGALRYSPDARVSCDLPALPFNSLGFCTALRRAAATWVPHEPRVFGVVLNRRVGREAMSPVWRDLGYREQG